MTHHFNNISTDATTQPVALTHWQRAAFGWLLLCANMWWLASTCCPPIAPPITHAEHTAKSSFAMKMANGISSPMAAEPRRPKPSRNAPH